MGVKDYIPDFRSWNRWSWLRLFAMTVLIVVSVAVFFLLIFSGKLEDIIEYIQGIGYWGNLLFIALFTLFGLPIPSGYTVLGMACGFIYGRVNNDPDVWGFFVACMTVLIGSIVGCWFGFYVTRLLMYNWVMQQAEQKPTLGAFVSLIRERGFIIIVLMRICPIPFGMQNTLFALGDISFISYIIASVIGLAPEIVMLVYMGASLGQVSALVSGGFHFSTLNWIMLGIEVSVSVVLLIILAILSRQAMKKVREKQREREKQASDEDGGPQFEVDEDGVSIHKIDGRVSANEYPSPFDEGPSDAEMSHRSSFRHSSSLPVMVEGDSCDVWVLNPKDSK